MTEDRGARGTETQEAMHPELHTATGADRAGLLVEKARQALRDGLEQQAFDCYAESLTIYRALDDRKNILRVLIRLSYLSGWADFGDGLDMFTRRQTIAAEALPLAREVGEDRLLAQALCAFSAGVFGEPAVAMLEESMRLARSCGDTGTLAVVLGRLANTCALQRNYKRAAALNAQALRLYRKLGDQAGEAQILFSMAIRARTRKRALLERALEIQRALGAKRRIVELLMQLDPMCTPNELDRREAINREAIALCREFGSPIWEASRLNCLAEIARLRGNQAEAEALAAESTRVYQPPPIDPEVEAAFEAALKSGDMAGAVEAVKKF